MPRCCAALSLLVCVLALPALGASEEEGGLKVTGLLDIRGVATDDTRSWLDGGLGKTRYGPPVAGRATMLRLSQLSLLVDVPIDDWLTAHLQVNGEADGDRERNRSHIDVIEAFVDVRQEPSARVRLRGRAPPTCGSCTTTIGPTGPRSTVCSTPGPPASPLLRPGSRRATSSFSVSI